MAPIVAALLKFGFSALAPAVLARGQEVIQEKLGVDIGAALGTEEGRIKLKQLEMEHEQFLITAAQAADARELEYFREEVKDRSSAREENAKIATAENAPWYQKALMPAMAVMVTAGFFGCLGALFWLSGHNIKLDDNSRDVLIYAFGVLSAGFMAIMNYLFGSSHSSQSKDGVLASIVKGKQ